MQCEWKLKYKYYYTTIYPFKKFKLVLNHSKRIEYLNELLKQKKWTSKSPDIQTQNLTIYIDKEFENIINSVNTQELYWK